MNGPNLLSLSRILLTGPAAWAVLTDRVTVAGAILAAALASDFLDGWLARRRAASTELGRVLDPVADKVLAAGVLGALVRVGRVPVELAVVVVLRDLILLAVAWCRIRSGGPVPVAELPGKVAFTVLGVYFAGEVLGTGWPSWVPPFVGVVYVLGGLVYAARIPGLALGRVRFVRVLKGER